MGIFFSANNCYVGRPTTCYLFCIIVEKHIIAICEIFCVCSCSSDTFDDVANNLCSFFVTSQASTASNKRLKVSSGTSTTDGPTTSGSHVPASVPTSVSSCHDRGAAPTREISFGDQTIVPAGAERPTTRIDSETLALNRDNAMQRYKEKRKNRRHGHPYLTCLPHCFLETVIIMLTAFLVLPAGMRSTFATSPGS